MRTRREVVVLLMVGLVLAGSGSLAGCARPPGSASGTGTPAAGTATVASGAGSEPRASDPRSRPAAPPLVSRQPSSPPATASGVAPGITVSAGAGGRSIPLPECRADRLTTRNPGTLTYATGPSAPSPWFQGNDPANGRGYESALAYAVAARLGYDSDHVEWRRVDPVAALSGSTPGFDVEIAQQSLPEGRRSNADHSTGYFSVTTAVVAARSAPARRPTRLADLRTLRLGVVRTAAPAGSINEQVADLGAGRRLTPFGDPQTATAALRSRSVDALLTDAPTALALHRDGLTVLGELPTGRWQPPQLGMVLARRSPLTACVSAAVDSLRAEGVLTRLRNTWIAPTGLRPLR